jgi:hypothetical protein
LDKHVSALGSNGYSSETRKRHVRHRLRLGGRIHPQIAWAKLRILRDGATIASKKLWS